MPSMRAKMKLNRILSTEHADTLEFSAVPRSSSYPADGSDEDNTYARFSPTAKVEITVANPALVGAFKAGETYYVDFHEVPKPQQ